MVLTERVRISMAVGGVVVIAVALSTRRGGAGGDGRGTRAPDSPGTS
ncbi:hypothetical protein [Streptomyces pactum]|nr:hypothetical protein [Streptomyces pactum]